MRGTFVMFLMQAHLYSWLAWPSMSRTLGTELRAPSEHREPRGATTATPPLLGLMFLRKFLEFSIFLENFPENFPYLDLCWKKNSIFGSVIMRIWCCPSDFLFWKWLCGQPQHIHEPKLMKCYSLSARNKCFIASIFSNLTGFS